MLALHELGCSGLPAFFLNHKLIKNISVSFQNEIINNVPAAFLVRSKIEFASIFHFWFSFRSDTPTMLPWILL